MLKEIEINLDEVSAVTAEDSYGDLYGKPRAIKRILDSENPEQVIYLTGYTPLTASRLGFAGKMNLYGISLLGGNLQGSRSGGLIAEYLTRLGITGIRITGISDRPHILYIDQNGYPSLEPLSGYGSSISGTFDLAQSVYDRHGKNIALALTDPSSTGFRYNAVVCNSKQGEPPDRAAARSTSLFGRNGLVGIAVAGISGPVHSHDFDRRELSGILKKIHSARRNSGLTGSSDPDNPALGGTYGGAAKARLDGGHGLTNLFRSARVPDRFYRSLLPDTIIRGQLRLSEESGIPLTRHSCIPGCPNRCSQVILLRQDNGKVLPLKSGEWETWQGVINLGVFEDAHRISASVIEHSNRYAYDHIEALITLATLALASEGSGDTGVRYGDPASVISALEQAASGCTDLGRLIRMGAAAVEDYYGLERHFTIGGHALPFHNGRSLLQTGIGMSWTYGRHGESCAGPGRHNFLGNPYNPADHSLQPEEHVLNTVHGMILYGAMDEQGMCFFMGPSVDSLVDNEMILHALNLPGDPKSMVRNSADTILSVYNFNKSRDVNIRPLPETFRRDPTWGNSQGPEDGVVFNVPFDIIRDYGLSALMDVSEGRVTIPDSVLNESRSRY